MNTLTAKELSAIQDLLSVEELNIKKFQMLAASTEDSTLKQKFSDISNKHQQHFDTLYSQLG
ncbi:MAG: hypothetical protein K0S71_2532 [Clostridia bacterium]|jgi:rubrerythrin|nr:hypothetical protein [Clostridia bacterium]